MKWFSSFFRNSREKISTTGGRIGAALKKFFKAPTPPPMVYEGDGIRIERLSSPTVFFARCGHLDAAKAIIKFHGRTFGAALDKKILAYDNVCPRCFIEKLKTMLISCCRCGKMIVPGDAALLHPKEPGPAKFSNIRQYGEREIGCSDIACSEDAGRLAGMWGEGKLTPLFDDGRTIAEDQAANGGNFGFMRQEDGSIAIASVIRFADGTASDEEGADEAPSDDSDDNPPKYKN